MLPSLLGFESGRAITRRHARRSCIAACSSASRGAHEFRRVELMGGAGSPARFVDDT